MISTTLLLAQKRCVVRPESAWISVAARWEREWQLGAIASDRDESFAVKVRRHEGERAVAET